MVAKYLPPGQIRKDRLDRIKNYIGQDVSEQAAINRGGNGSGVTKSTTVPGYGPAKLEVPKEKPIKQPSPKFAPVGPLRKRSVLKPKPALSEGKYSFNRGGFANAAARRLKRMS